MQKSPLNDRLNIEAGRIRTLAWIIGGCLGGAAWCFGAGIIVSLIIAVIACFLVSWNEIRKFRNTLTADDIAGFKAEQAISTEMVNVKETSDAVVGMFYDTKLYEWVDIVMPTGVERFTYFRPAYPKSDGTFELPEIKGKLVARVEYGLYTKDA